MTTHLIIPDAHAHYQYDNQRFEWLGDFILDRKPEVIVHLGDFADMPALSKHGEGLSFEGRRLKEDVEVTHDALKRMWGPVNKYNARRRKNKDKQYRPRKVITLGNHEDRINRHCEEHPALSEWLDISILNYENYFDEIHPYRVPVTIDQISYSHFFATGVSGRPISGENIGRALCGKLHASCVQGHSHVFDHAERVTATGQRIFGLSAGCYVHPDYVEDWCRGTVQYWWRGIVILHDIDGEGYYDRMEHITMRWLEREYG
ncbi:uncharacterized protein METZ01_LOCUS299690 [marine metagenome]|uniref:Uncharacterized protein n=1 Tax=marine metagenome TaxID=408172 RepID=A0A382MDF4_9ZZZZ